MIVGIFAAAAAAASVVYCAAAGFAAGKLILAFLLCFLALHVIFITFLFVITRPLDLTKPIEEKKKIYYWGGVRIGELVDVYLRVHTTLTGEEKLPRDGRFLLVCNHRSMQDPLTTLSKLRKYDLAFISKKDNSKIPVIWPLAYGFGCLPIDRENDREALKTIINAANYIKKDFCSMCIYPEGTRSSTEELLPFKAGALKIAQKAGVPIVVASLDGTQNVKKNFPWRRTEVRLNILELIPADKVKATGTTELSEYCRELITEDLKKGAAK